MSADAEKLAILRSVAEALQTVHELVAQPLNQRPPFPAITSPNSGDIITASQAAPTSLPVHVSSNRSDQAHVIDLLDADTFAVLGGPIGVVFAGNTGTATVTIPTLAGPGPTTLMLQCRVPASVAGNAHRILIDVQAPALPPTPTVAMSAVSGAGVPLPSGSYPRATPGLSNVSFTATAASGTAPFSYRWTVRRGINPAELMTTVGDTRVIDLMPAGTLFPTFVSVDCYVSDANGLNSVSSGLSFIIT